MFRCGLAFVIGALSFGSPVLGQSSEAQCQAAMGRALSPDMFADYPVAPSPPRLKPAPPDVKSGQAHLYRSTIRAQARMAPDFAGHYRIVMIGCGAGVVCPAIYDRASGRVTFPRQPRSVDQLLLYHGEAEAGYEQLTYRLDSRLLIATGTINEDRRKRGIGYYLWRGDRFSLLRFVPIRQLCAEPR